jgi:hypothetical protein
MMFLVKLGGESRAGQVAGENLAVLRPPKAYQLTEFMFVVGAGVDGDGWTGRMSAGDLAA